MAAIAGKQLAAGAIGGKQVGVVDANGLSPLLVIRKSFSAGGGGSADDVTIYGANAPFGFRVVDSWLYVLTAVGGSTCTLRDATGGAGNALSDAFSSAATGKKENTALTATRTIAANGTVVLRRSDNGVAGEVFLLAQKE